MAVIGAVMVPHPPLIIPAMAPATDAGEDLLETFKNSIATFLLLRWHVLSMK